MKWNQLEKRIFCFSMCRQGQIHVAEALLWAEPLSDNHVNDLCSILSVESVGARYTFLEQGKYSVDTSMTWKGRDRRNSNNPAAADA